MIHLQRAELTEQIGKLNIKIAKANKELDEIESKSNNTENIPEFGKILIKDGIKNNEIDFKLNVG